MTINGLVAGLLVTATLGLICTSIMLFYLYKGKVKINSSYNYRPKWAQVNLPGEMKDKINLVGVKWLVFDSGALFCAIIIGCIYGLVSGDLNLLKLFLLVCVNLWVFTMFAIIIGVYVYAWSLEKQYKASKS